MKYDDKVLMFEQLKEDGLDADFFYETLEKCGALKKNYREYLTTSPIDCDKELLRLENADYDLCCALLTMSLREDHFDNGRFERRQRRGQVRPIVERILAQIAPCQREHISSFSEKTLEALNGFYV